jgi:hypothetical protein
MHRSVIVDRSLTYTKSLSRLGSLYGSILVPQCMQGEDFMLELREVRVWGRCS